MVSIRHRPSPSPAEISGARQVPDEPPPRPSHNSIRETAHLDQSTSHGAVQVNGSVSHPQPLRNVETNNSNEQLHGNATTIPNGTRLNGLNPGLPAAQRGSSPLSKYVRNEVDEDDSDVPEEASASMAAENALAQRALERQTRTSVRDRRRSRRRVAAEKQRREAQERNGHEAVSNNHITGEKKIKLGTKSTEQNGDRGIDNEAREDSVLLSEEMLQAVQRAVGEKRKAERELKRAERLKLQSKKVPQHLAIRQVAGVEIQIGGRLRKRTEARGRGKRNPATTFLQRCMRNAGERVPSAIAARITSAAKRKKK